MVETRGSMCLSQRQPDSSDELPAKVSGTQPDSSDELPAKLSGTQPDSSDELPAKLSGTQPDSSDELPAKVSGTQPDSSDELPAKVSLTQPDSSDELPAKVSLIQLDSSDELPAKVSGTQLVSSDELPAKVSVTQPDSSDELPAKMSRTQPDSSDKLPAKVSLTQLDNELREQPSSGAEAKPDKAGAEVQCSVRCLLITMSSLECTTIGGSLKQIDASVGQVVGMSSTDAVFVCYGNNWVQLPEALKHMSVGLSGVWGVNKDNYIYKIVGGNWQQTHGLLKQIDAGGDEFVAGVNLNDNICLNVHSTDPIPWNLLPGALKYYSCGPYNCWEVNSGDQIYVMKGVTPSSCMGSNTWQNIPGALSMIEVSTDSSVYGVNSGGDVFCRQGITASNPAGTDWVHLLICGKSKHVSYDLGVLWVIGQDDSIQACHQTPQNKKKKITSYLIQVNASQLTNILLSLSL
ncbi:uncharacterized protein LOC131723388 [Acipenser ruthenus]|uniref:uncharacterized protein LOC131723388 n=1 Tax=Acipenser ruthenus TaxID=7906 RepID=UPI0027410C28|nr:uncharacterized protein LOC131723388 [Acipenser ruthenus]